MEKELIDVANSRNGKSGVHSVADNRCRFCDYYLVDTFVDLGMSPLANAYVSKEDLNKADPFFPLKAYVCSSCFLVQLQEFEAPASIFSDYAYFSSYSDSWLEHAREYSNMAIRRFDLTGDSLVVELASNDGYLLKNFVENDIPCLGIEPAENIAKIAVKAGIPTIIEFFGEDLAVELVKDRRGADLLVGNNVLAHVPDINDFVGGIKIILKEHGVATLEFPHLLNLVNENQFDTIYHEHFSYLSLLSVQSIFNYHGLKIFDVDELSTHGGSIRIYVTHYENTEQVSRPSVDALIEKEINAGMKNIDYYTGFSKEVKILKRNILKGFIELKKNGKSIVGYGAAAKGNTLLNYCGIGTDIIDYVVDRNPEKVGKFLPGSRLPIKDILRIERDRPDYLFILPWNLKDEIISQNEFIRNWGGKFIIPIPDFHIVD